MSEWPYDLLDIGEDADERTIKRAYARLLKLHRPDEDPAGFQRLNEAYMFCLRQLEVGVPHAPQGIVTDAPDPPTRRASEPSPATIAAFDVDNFITALHERSQTASGRDILGWLRVHPAFYSIGSRETHAHEIVHALLRVPALPPRHVAAVLHFLELDTAGPARARLEPSVSALERYAQMTIFDAEAIRQPCADSPAPSSSGNLGWLFGISIWIALFAMILLSRCSGGGA